MHPRLALLVLPFTRAEFPKWPVLVDFVSAGWDEAFRDQWAGLSMVVIRGKKHRLLMSLDLSDWSQRMTFFLGRYYEMGVLGALDMTLRPGDRFVDIGANIGMITLHAHSLVGKSGRIDCFEPNPFCAEAIRNNLKLNEISNVFIHECALAETAGSLTLNLTSEHTGTATLADVSARATHKINVDVRVGDNALVEAPRMIKIDVEGFELQALRGLAKTLSTFKPLLITELIEHQLALAGTSVRETAEFLFDLGYRAYGIGTRRRLLRHRLTLSPIGRGGDFTGFSDVLWAHRDDPTPLGC